MQFLSPEGARTLAAKLREVEASGEPTAVPFYDVLTGFAVHVVVGTTELPHWTLSGPMPREAAVDWLQHMTVAANQIFVDGPPPAQPLLPPPD